MEARFKILQAQARNAESTFAQLLSAKTPDLFVELGARALRMDQSRKIDEDTNLRGRGEASDAGGFGQKIDQESFQRDAETQEFGERLFQRWSSAFHEFICKREARDSDLRNQVLNAISGGSAGGSAILAAVLVSYFALSPAIAAIVAALVIRLVVAPAAEEVCAAWTRTLSA